MNNSKYSNSKYDELVTKGSLEVDFKKQYDYYLKAEKLLVGTAEDQDAAFVPLYYSCKAYVQKKYVKDLFRHPYGPEYTLKWVYIKNKNYTSFGY